MSDYDYVIQLMNFTPDIPLPMGVKPDDVRVEEIVEVSSKHISVAVQNTNKELEHFLGDEEDDEVLAEVVMMAQATMYISMGLATLHAHGVPDELIGEIVRRNNDKARSAVIEQHEIH